MIKKETMKSRQRVLHALNHEPVDRVPIDLGMHLSSGISAFAYKNLRDYLGLDSSKIEVIDPQQFLARVEEDVMRRFHIDCIMLHPGYLKTHRWTARPGYEFVVPEAMKPVALPDGGWFVGDGTSSGLKMPNNGYFFDGVGFDFWKEEEDSIIARYAAEAKRIYEQTDYFTMYVGYGAYYMGDLDFICELMTDEDEARAKIKWLHEWNFKHFDKLRKACGNHIQGVCLGGDLGIQNGPMLDPKLYEREIHPYVKEFCRYIHETSDYKIFMHSCGAVREFIPYFIDQGIDALNPVQISADGMEPNGLKKDFGDKIAFWGGGCNTQFILNMGNAKDVTENTKMLTNVFKKNSGFVFNQVHNVMGDIKVENIVAMLDAAYENGFTE